MGGTDDSEKPRDAGLAIIAFGVIIAGLVYGRSFLVPLAMAVFLWNVLEAMIQGFGSIRIGRWRPPRWLAVILGLTTVVLGFYLIAFILLGQADAISAAWPRYVARFESIVDELAQWLGSERSAKVKEALAEIDLTSRIPGLLASTQSVILSALLVIAYIGFLFVERDQLSAKISAMFPDQDKARDVAKLLANISDNVRRYIWFKTILSVLTGVACYAVLRVVGIDFAETWALLIFALNYIPNIGSIVGVAFPTLLALVQFETLGPFFVLVASLTAIQVMIGSVLEPMLMGRGLNMSPFAIILSLTFWGIIWGIAGMLLSVPILVVVMIVCAHVPSWRWIAILLSKDGNITT